ncbi:LysR family transcriptional regulator [Burkholderia pyrrocinia]|uniref:LysR family transcriptional regulator n=1 Tax=Burkholderia sp. IT-111MI5 TaxID=3026439 RepID=UPI002A2F8473|nr:LysR family transcriptional regulator [Burkholderia pyrrocinia]EKS9892705.1 LysR family transcriptional regulator [Burkholderia pyrrocinia]EKS9906553.1 LysR family transcriptional regulator [Burkholderia pyrrocinia]
MNLRKLQHVIALARYQTFSRACAEVHLSQSALSRSIQSIESEFGFPLFDRSAQGIALTPYGKVFVDRARRIDFEMRELVRDLALLERGEFGEICIGLGATPAALLRQPILTFGAVNAPNVRVVLKRGNTADLLGMLMAERIDMFVGDIASLTEQPEIEIMPLPRWRAAFFCGRTHPLGGMACVSPEALLKYPIGSTHLSRYALDDLHQHLGFSIADRIKLQSDDFGELEAAAAVSEVVILGSLPVFDEAVRANRLHQIPLNPPLAGSARLGIVALAGRTPSVTMGRINALVRDVFKKFSEESATN